MKKIIWMICLLMLISLPAAAQDADWQVSFFEDYDDNSFSWPLGTEVQGSTEIIRSIQQSAYVWNITTADPNVLWMGLNLGYPDDAVRYRFSSEIRLPEFDPLACGGLLLDNLSDSFYAYVICNDKTYSLFRYANGETQTLIPFLRSRTMTVSMLLRSLPRSMTAGWTCITTAGAWIPITSVSAKGLSVWSPCLRPHKALKSLSVRFQSKRPGMQPRQHSTRPRWTPTLPRIPAGW